VVREAGFEPAVFLMWQILSLLRFTYFATLALVLPVGFEPTSSPHLEASPRYKLGALTVMLWEQTTYSLYLKLQLITIRFTVVLNSV